MSIDAFSVSAFNGPALWLLGMFGLEGGTRRGLEFFRMLRVDKSDDLLGCFFSLSLFFCFLLEKWGYREFLGNGVEFQFLWNGSGLTSRVKYLSKYLFVEIGFFSSPKKFELLFLFHSYFSDKVIRIRLDHVE